jgi:hypothetical protein
LQSVARIMAVLSCIESKNGARKGSNLTLTQWRFSTAATAGQIAVDGDGVLWRRRTGDDGDDPETKGAAAIGRGSMMFEVIFNRTVRWKYIYTCAVGGTE